jgi:glycosyltransferase involved in cell wall biosynthesis
MRKLESILVITTRENSRWWSMQEIIPAIEQVWTKIGQSGKKNVRFFNVSSDTNLSWQEATEGVDRVVVTAATPGAVQRALDIRKRLKPKAPLYIYIHGDATAGFTAFGSLLGVLRESDTFVVSCESDAKAVKMSFHNPRVFTIPFPLVDKFQLRSEPHASVPASLPLVYVGRVSEQKNLHTLLMAIWLLRRIHRRLPKITLDIYGREDNYGSPNMSMNYPSYGTYLKGLASDLELDHIVNWHGFKSREWIFENVHTQPHIFVSSTLHSDENFGASGLASLVNGSQAVMTAWGGHLGFQKWFPEQLSLVKVHGSARGPVVHPFLLAEAIAKASQRFHSVTINMQHLEKARAEFSENRSLSYTLKMLAHVSRVDRPLRKTELLNHILKSRKSFGNGRRLFANYQDLSALPYFKAYGMEDMLPYRPGGNYLLPPWATYFNSEFRISDPHRGPFTMNLDDRSPHTEEVWMCPDLKATRLPPQVLPRLILDGSLFLIPPGILRQQPRERTDSGT